MHSITENIFFNQIQLLKISSTKLNSGFNNYMTWYDISMLSLLVYYYIMHCESSLYHDFVCFSNFNKQQ